MADWTQQNGGHGGNGGGDKSMIWSEFKRELEEMNWKQQVYTTLQRYFCAKGRRAMVARGRSGIRDGGKFLFKIKK